MSLNASHNCTPIQEYIVDDLSVSTYVKLIFGFIYVILFIFGIVGNGGVVIAFMRFGQLRTAQNLLLLNLIVADILLCLTAVPVTPLHVFKKEWTMGLISCKLFPLCQSCSVVITSWALAAISIDKYVHITGPTRPPIRLSTALLVTVLIWTTAIAANIPYMLSYKLVPGSLYKSNILPKGFCGEFCNEEWTNETQRVIYGWVILALQFLLPLGIIAFCYTNILITVRKDMIIQNSSFASSLTANQRSAQEEIRRKVTYILIAMVCTFVLSWLPLSLVNILRDLAMLPYAMASQPYLVVLIVHSIAMTSVLWNPMLFFWLTRMRSRKTMKNNKSTTYATINDCSISRITRSRPESRCKTNTSCRSSPYFVDNRKFKMRIISKLTADSPLVEENTNHKDNMQLFSFKEQPFIGASIHNKTTNDVDRKLSSSTVNYDSRTDRSSSAVENERLLLCHGQCEPYLYSNPNAFDVPQNLLQTPKTETTDLDEVSSERDISYSHEI